MEGGVRYLFSYYFFWGGGCLRWVVLCCSCFPDLDLHLKPTREIQMYLAITRGNQGG